jgi:hypothetical protein
LITKSTPLTDDREFSQLALDRFGEHITFTELEKAVADNCVADYTDYVTVLEKAAEAGGGGRHRRASHIFGCIGHFATEECASGRRERRASHVGSAVCTKIVTSKRFGSYSATKYAAQLVFTELEKADAEKCVADFADLDGAYAAVDGGRHRRASHAGGCVGHFATLACAGSGRRERRAGHVGSAVCTKIVTSKRFGSYSAMKVLVEMQKT